MADLLVAACPGAPAIVQAIRTRKRLLRLADSLALRVDRHAPADVLAKAIGERAEPRELLDQLNQSEWLAVARDLSEDARELGRQDKHLRPELMAIGRLPALLQDATRLVELEGIDADGAAARLGISREEVQVRVLRAKVTLRRIAYGRVVGGRKPVDASEPDRPGQLEEIAGARAAQRRAGRVTAPRLPGNARVRGLLLMRPPATRGDCEGGYRPCPFGSCKHHLGAPYRTPEGRPRPSADTCVLDVVDRQGGEEGMILSDIGDQLGVTRERARQLIQSGLRRIPPAERRHLGELLNDHLDAERRAWP